MSSQLSDSGVVGLAVGIPCAAIILFLLIIYFHVSRRQQLANTEEKEASVGIDLAGDLTFDNYEQLAGPQLRKVSLLINKIDSNVIENKEHHNNIHTIDSSNEEKHNLKKRQSTRKYKSYMLPITAQNFSRPSSSIFHNQLDQLVSAQGSTIESHNESLNVLPPPPSIGGITGTTLISNDNNNNNNKSELTQSSSELLLQQYFDGIVPLMPSGGKTGSSIGTTTDDSHSIRSNGSIEKSSRKSIFKKSNIGFKGAIIPTTVLDLEISDNGTPLIINHQSLDSVNRLAKTLNVNGNDYYNMPIPGNNRSTKMFSDKNTVNPFD